MLWGSMKHVRANWPIVAIPLVGALALAVLAARGYGPHWFRYSDFALALAGFGTLSLAFVTFALVKEERLSREAEKQRAEDERLEEERRRPELTLLSDGGDDGFVHSYAENETTIYVRLPVRNAVGTRASSGTRVLFDSLHRQVDERPTTFGSPYLGWTSAHAPDESVVIFAGATRIIDLGELRLNEGPRFRISLPGVTGDIPHERQYVPTGTAIKLVVGSDEAETRFYLVTVFWGDPTGIDISAKDFLEHQLAVHVVETTAEAPLLKKAQRE